MMTLVAWWLAQLIERQTCDQEMDGSSPSLAVLRSNHGQGVDTSVPLSPSSILAQGW